MRRTKMPASGRTRLSLSLFPACLAIAILVVPIGFAAGPAPDVLLNTMQNELKRAGAALGKSEPPAYYLSYSVADVVSATLAASNGAIYGNTRIEERPADVIMRVGSEALDNTHGQYRASGVSSGVLPLTDNPDATARILWQLTSNEYERASSSFLQVKTNQQVQAAEEDKSPDFSNETPQHHPGDATKPALTFDQSAWATRLKRLSADFLKYPDVYTSYVTLSIQSKKQYFANTEGTAVVEPSSLARLVIEAETRADDGMDLFRVETFQEDTADKLPSDAELQAKIEKMATDVKALRNAPTADAYAGPAMLSGRAAAVFFHEVLGHRLEGHRQRGDSEGQTFTKQINKLVMPSFITVTDDPTIKQLNGIRLSGTYQFDDEGVPAQRVVAVDNGVLKNFLMSRMPNQNFSQSNGHGRSQIGLMATGRQGNLLVTSTNTVSETELRKRFIDEIKKQGKTYGLYFDDIEGGFTLTSRGSPQAFEVLPILVYRVYADGRPDELVRGVDIVGTPLVALNSILVTGDKEEVFNGICGAESGQIPVSAAAPAMLFSELEVQKAATGANRPPILAPPEGESFSAISAGGIR